MRLTLQLLDDAMDAPKRAHPGDAGLDLSARTGAMLSASTGPVAVPTGVAVAIPQGHVGLVCPRSGLALEEGITVANSPGVIDAEFRGEIMVVLFRTRHEPFSIRRGDRIAQLLVLPIVSDLELVLVPELQASPRGADGLGSSGR